MSQHFPKPFKSFLGNINVKVDLSNYATKPDLKNVTHVDTSSFALKKTVYDKLVAKVNNIDTSYFVSKTKYNTDKTELEKKIPTVTDFVKKAKLTELENKIPDISNLPTKTALTAVENKIHDVHDLVKKTDYNTKVTEIENKVNNHNHNKYIDTPEFNKLPASVFNARLTQANLITKPDFDAKLSGINRKIMENKTENVLAKNELNKLKTFDSDYLLARVILKNMVHKII